MVRVEKKILSQYFDQVTSGKKKAEIRIADFEINEGDTLVLREWNPEAQEYTGRELEKNVTCVNKFQLEDLYRLNSEAEIKEHGIQVISVE